MANLDIRNIGDYTPDPGSGDGAMKELWHRTTADDQPVDAWVYVVKAGHSWPPDHYRPQCSELILGWGGSGKVLLRRPDRNVPWPQWEAAPQWETAVQAVDIGENDSVLVPRGALRRFTAHAGQDLVLVVVHAADPFVTASALGNGTPTQNNTKEFIRNLDAANKGEPGEIMESRRRRAKRNRVWGVEMKSPGGPLPDPSKEEFHLVQYVFKPSQWNMAHFHPHSVELVVCRKGEGEASVVFPKVAGTFPGWDKASTETVTLKPGATMIVPRAALHEYWDKTEKDDLYLLAMQTPQPIMHITEAEL